LKLSRFNVAVGYVAGKDNGVADILSRWAYPAGSALKDVSIHGSVEDDEAMMAIIQKEKEEERQCAVLDLKWPAGLRKKSWKSGQQVAVVEVRKPRVLDLFCGGGSWSNYFRKLGFEVHSLDFDPKFRPTICADILEWDMQQFPPGFFDVVVASPPCEEFSFAKTRSPRDLAKGDRLVLRALQIVEYLQPSVWMLENPRALLVHRPYMQGIPFVDIDYCMFSDWGYRKRTRIWGSACIASLKSRLCDGTCGHVVEEYPGGPKRHEVWLGGRGPQVSWKDKIRIPERAVAYLCGGVGIRRRRRHKVAVVGQGEQKSQGSPKPGASEAAPPAGAAKFAFKSPPPGARRFRNTPPPPPAPVKEEEDDSPALGPDEGEPAPPEFGSPLSSLTPSERSWEEESVKDEDVEVKLEEESADLPEEPSVSVFDEDWAFWYRQSQWWSKPWRIVQRQGGDWPKGFQLHENRLFFSGKLCVPWGLTGRVVRAHHEAVGHIGAQRLWAQMSRFYEWADVARARFFSRRVQSQCELCQACEHPHHPLHMPIEPTPVPPRLMDNVCIDVFVMPAVKVGSESFDCFVACVDRLSGWIVAFPATKLGLSADKVAREMFARAWDLFGVPRVVSSDQGPQFASAWWHTLCGCLGIRQAFGHAYHHQANGRAEVAGKELQRKLRLLHGQGGGSNWVELLPVALRHIHDTPGVTGLSPYEIITGRHRNMVGVPYPVERQAQDALLFLERQKAMDKKVADLLNARHEREAAVENAKRRQVTVFIPGDKVWYLRPRSLGTNKTQSWWLGPCLVKARTGLASYVIEERPGFEHSAHRSQLKPHIEDPMEGDKLPLHFFRRTLGEELEAEDEWVVDRILKHRVGEDGKLQFLTKWEGFAETDATWEPVGHFFHRYSFPFVQYCKLHKIVFDAAQYLSTKPVERGVRPPSGSSSAGRRAEATRTS
jgi:transposase InsO family protein